MQNRAEEEIFAQKSHVRLPLSEIEEDAGYDATKESLLSEVRDGEEGGGGRGRTRVRRV